MSDLVSRKAVIDALYGITACKNQIPLFSAVFNIEKLPSAESERKKGEWIPQNYNKTDGMTSTAVYYYPHCSVCGHCDNYTNFCSNCGADMRKKVGGE